MDNNGSMEFARRIGTSREYASECSIQSVVQICVELGIDRADERSLEALADVARYFVNAIAQRSHANMVHGQRGVVALNDVLSAFHQAPTAQISWRALNAFADEWNVPSLIVVPNLPVPFRQHKRKAYSEPKKGLPFWFPKLPKSKQNSQISISEIKSSSKKLKLALSKIEQISPNTQQDSIDLTSTGEVEQLDDNFQQSSSNKNTPLIATANKTTKLNLKLLLHPPSAATAASLAAQQEGEMPSQT
uniref:Bromodomain associated domain-containing protein n=1 Tax=Aureoumbra lagunensis TaxID=44058 RepID=A0A7S3JZI9_9STRA|mmetsp:Transcript_1114/g.1389  ORF Transcript_1114/g.1389 Transcript_1114/m.1389 type:complete len:247 (-) Transcript_1114:109-849(-)